MTGVIAGCDLDQIARKSAGYWEGFSGTGAELGGLEDGYGLAVEGQDVLLGEAREGAGEGLARDAGGLRHLLAGERGLEGPAPPGHAPPLGGGGGGARERAPREMPAASAISWRESEGSKTTPRLVTRPSSVARFRSIRATLPRAPRPTRPPTRAPRP